MRREGRGGSHGAVSTATKSFARVRRHGFGPDEDCEKLPPACVDPLRKDEAARIKELREAQDYALQCQQGANRAEDKLDDVEREFAEFKALTGCDGSHELRMWMDSQRGRVVTANALIEAFRQADPALFA